MVRRNAGFEDGALAEQISTSHVDQTFFADKWPFMAALEFENNKASFSSVEKPDYILSYTIMIGFGWPASWMVIVSVLPSPETL